MLNLALAMEEKHLAYFKYSGKPVENGYFDIRKSITALEGIDETLRFFLIKKNEDLGEIQFEIPVKIRQGSWEALLPDGIGEWIQAAVGVGGTTYLTTVLREMAKHDAKDKGLKDGFREIIKGLKWSIRIAKHIGAMGIRKFQNIKIKLIDGIHYVSVMNDKEEEMLVPKKYFDIYNILPEDAFEKLTKPVTDEIEFSIDLGDIEARDNDDTSEPEVIGISHKAIFSNDEDQEETLFPELEHGHDVELEGHVTRGNQKTNTIGFQYSGHILTCTPASGNIKSFKDRLFNDCIIIGTVDRVDKQGKILEKKPRIRFTDLINISNPEKEDKQTSLF